MSRRSFRIGCGVAAALGCALVAAGVSIATRSHARAAHAGAPSVLAVRTSAFQSAPARREKAKQHGNEAVRGRESGPAAEDYENRAYPSAYIAFAQTQHTEEAEEEVEGHRGTRHAKPWQELGPQTLNVDQLATQTLLRPTQWSGRVSAMAIDPRCGVRDDCKLYVGAAGGGVWKTDNAMAPNPEWKPISDGLASSAIGTIVIDPTDRKTIYVGTGEGNGSSDSEAGVGLYRSDNGGRDWRLLAGSVAVSKSRSIAALAVDPANPRHLLMGTAVARHGSSSANGGRFTPPDAPPVGLYQSTDGGDTWTPALILPQDAVNPGSATGGDFFAGGVTHIEYEPNAPATFYLSVFGYGLFRSTTNGGSFENIFTPQDPFNFLAVRYEFATAKLTGGKTRIYLGAGDDECFDPDPGFCPLGIDASKLYRIDDASVPASTLTDGVTNPGWTLLSSPTDGTPGFSSFDFCQTQCSYDMVVVSPPGQPDTVWIGGAMQYSELPPYGGPDRSNGRAVLRSTNAGVQFTDMSGDARSPMEDIHPDQHAIVFNPSNPDVAFIGSDGGVARTSGQYVDGSPACGARGLSGVDLADCQTWLSAIPSTLTTMNAGLRTLQFQSLTANPANTLGDVIGGTQDNGTLGYSGSGTWIDFVSGDGGQSGIDPVDGNVRYHTYFGPQGDVNFHGNNPSSWDWMADPLVFAPENASFYVPFIADPVKGGSAFVGLTHVWRTTDSGGDPTFLDNHCNTTGIGGHSDALFTGACGDWVPLGSPGGAPSCTFPDPGVCPTPDYAPGDLTGTAYGSDKLGHYVVAIARAPSDTSTLWAATRRGRLFVSQNADAADPAAVTFTRIDTPATPTRFVSGISVDSSNPLHAVVSFSGYDAYATAAGTVVGHVFDVVYNPGTSSAAWTDLSNDLGDQPITDVVLDAAAGDIYVSTDFGVNRLPSGASSWITAANGLPPVAVYGLTLAGGKRPGDRVLYAATHGRGAWRIQLPDVKRPRGERDGHGEKDGQGERDRDRDR